MKHTILIWIVLFPAALWANNYSVDTLIIESDILNEERIILLHTPINFTETKPVKVIYMVDGEYCWYRFPALIKKNSPDVVGIGIVNTDRRRDLLPLNNAEKFNKFIEEELMPIIEEKFRAKEKILYGHSLAGAFTLYSFINHPGMFNTYIVSSPTPIMDMVDSEIYVDIDKKLKSPVKLYLSYASKDFRQVKKWTSRLIQNLEDIETLKLSWISNVIEDKNHYNSDSPALIVGFKN